VHAMRDILDKQIVDRNKDRLGRVDGIIVELSESGPPRIAQLEVGFVSLARRIHPRFEAFAEAVHKRLDIRRGARFHIPWEQISEVHAHHLVADLDAEETPAFDWERWLRRHVVEKLPGGKSAKVKKEP